MTSDDSQRDWLEAARSLAQDLISAARDWVLENLGEFGAALVAAVEYLADKIVELATALVQFIEDAVNAIVDAVTALVTMLVEAVTALVNWVVEQVTAAWNAFKSAIETAIRFATAVLTGDWETVARMALEAVLGLAGIPVDDFMSLIAAAMESIDLILDDPFGFVSNAIGAVVQGFQQFVGNFLEHLKTGFFEWIVGPLGDIGITLPDTWDIWGVLSIVLQVLGLTKEGIRGVVEQELGATAATVFEYVWGYIEALVTGGLEGRVPGSGVSPQVVHRPG